MTEAAISEGIAHTNLLGSRVQILASGVVLSFEVEGLEFSIKLSRDEAPEFWALLAEKVEHLLRVQRARATPVTVARSPKQKLTLSDLGF